MAQTKMKIRVKKTWEFRITMFLLEIGLGKLALKLFENSPMIKYSCNSKKEDIYLSEFWEEVKNS